MSTTPGPDSPASGQEPAGIEERLLGGPRRYTRAEAAGKAGLSVDYARRLWRAVGFADVGDEPVAFTDGDLAALDRLKHLIEVGVLDDELAVSVTRAVGHNAARLAEWQVDALVEHLVEQGRSREDAHRVAAEQSADHLADFEQLLVAVWRRQLASVAGRVLAAAASETVTAVARSASPTWCPTPGCRSGSRSASWPPWSSASTGAPPTSSRPAPAGW